MKSTKLAGRYAKALFDFAQQKEEIEAVNSDLVLVKSVLKENSQLKAVIESPVIFPDKKNDIFTDLFEGKISKTTFGFLSLIIKKKREPSLSIICDEYLKLYNIHHNIKIAYITTVFPLSEELAAALKKLLEEETHATIQIQEKVDPNIIGGLLIKIDDFLFNASILAKINKLRAEFSYNVYQAAF